MDHLCLWADLVSTLWAELLAVQQLHNYRVLVKPKNGVTELKVAFSSYKKYMSLNNTFCTEETNYFSFQGKLNSTQSDLNSALQMSERGKLLYHPVSQDSTG